MCDSTTNRRPRASTAAPIGVTMSGFSAQGDLQPVVAEPRICRVALTGERQHHERQEHGAQDTPLNAASFSTHLASTGLRMFSSRAVTHASANRGSLIVASSSITGMSGR